MKKQKCFHMKSGIYISPEGNVRLCCVSKEQNFKKEINIDLIDDLQVFFNSNYYINLRKKDFKEIDICSTCIMREKLEQTSLRKMVNGEYYKKFNILPSLDDNNCLIEHLDISFSNVCNQQCLMCTSEFSSKWYKFDEKNKNTEFKRNPIKYKKWTNEKNISKIKKILPNLKLISIKGGEPLIQEEVKEILKFIKDNNINCHIRIVSNFQEISDEMFDILKCLKKLSITISLDSVGKRYEWIRGGNWKKTISNLEKYTKMCEHTPSISYTNTINVWSVKHLNKDIKILEKINSKLFRKDNKNSYNISIALHPKYVSPMLLSREERIDIIYNFEKEFGFITENYLLYKSLILNNLKTVLSLENEQSDIKENTLDISNQWENEINILRGKILND